MAVKGVFASDSGIPGDRKGDFASSLLQIHPTGSAQLFALTSGMENVAANETIVTWFEENKLSGRINVTNNAGTGTSLIVSDASFVVAGKIFLVEASGELVFVDSVTGSTLTVTRGFAGSNIAAIDGSSTPKPIQMLFTAFEEGSSRPTGVANLGHPRFNYTQIFRNSWDVTGTARSVQFYTGNVIAKNRRDAAFFHSEDIERALWFGRLSIGVKNNQPFRTMDGLVSQITTNVTSQSTNTSYLNIRNFLQSVFSRNVKGQPNERIAFCGFSVLGVLDTLAITHSDIKLVAGQTEFGFNITKWQTPFGMVSLMTHPLFNESPLWTKDLWVLHPGAMRLRYLRKTHEDSYDADGRRQGVDADYGVFTTELTMEYRAEITGGRFTGIDTAKTDGL